MLKPTKFEYEAPQKINGAASDGAAIKLEIYRSGSGWVGSLNITSLTLDTEGEVQAKIRDAIARVLPDLGGK